MVQRVTIAPQGPEFSRFCNAVNNFGLMCNQFWIAILATHDPELSISVLTPAL